MKPIVIRQHARDRMAEHGISEAAVLAAVRTPEWVGPDPRAGIHRRYSRPAELGGRVLRVACVEEEGHIRVLSAHPDRNARPPDGAANDLRSRG